jgi:hypothetical protein
MIKDVVSGQCKIGTTPGSSKNIYLFMVLFIKIIYNQSFTPMTEFTF